jgi:hypothetical protein
MLAFISAQCQTNLRGVLRGEGDAVRQVITLPDLKGINLSFAGDVILTQGSTQSIELEGQQNILDNIKREVRDGVWHIYFDKNVREAKPVTVRITLPHLEEVGLSGSGSVKSTNHFRNLNELDINVAGSGEIMLDYDASSTDLHLSGSGQIHLNGISKSLSVSISGSGDVMASDLKTEDCDVTISGSGDASVNASRELDTHISGSGDVRYSGSASVDAHISGTGEVTKMN